MLRNNQSATAVTSESNTLSALLVISGIVSFAAAAGAAGDNGVTAAPAASRARRNASRSIAATFAGFNRRGIKAGSA